MEKAGFDTQMTMASLPTTDERMEQLKEEYQVSERGARKTVIHRTCHLNC